MRCSRQLAPISSGESHLVFYYWSWVSGINFDVNFQELALVSFPGQGRWPLPLYVALVIFVVMALVLSLLATLYPSLPLIVVRHDHPTRDLGQFFLRGVKVAG